MKFELLNIFEQKLVMQKAIDFLQGSAIKCSPQEANDYYIKNAEILTSSFWDYERIKNGILITDSLGAQISIYFKEIA